MSMNCAEIIEKLKSEASEKYRSNIVKFGIPEAYCIGVPTAELRKLAGQLKKSNELAFALWDTRYHEARLLAAFLFERKYLAADQIDALMSEVISWDLCDHLCRNIIIKQKNYDDFIFRYITADHVHKRRAAFVLIAAAAIHDKKITKESLDSYLKLIREHSACEHEHIKKGASLALREIGKIDYEYNEKALLTAYDLLESGNKAQIFIAKEAIKELENVVKTDGRKRLISAHTKMGKEG